MGSKKEKKSRKEKKEKRDKEKRRKRHRSPSTSDSSSSDDEDYKRRKAEKLAQKVAQHLRKHKVTGTGYTNEDNPFGDTNLTERFVWGKKIEKELVSGRDVRDMTAKAEMRRQAERLEEIEKVKKRREQREAERAAMAEELEMIQRERAIAEAAELEKKEEQFHLEQVQSRSRQRLADGRPKAIDRLLQSAFPMEDIEPLMEEPYSVIQRLSLRELKALKDDIAAFAELDRHDVLHRDFWAAVALVTDAELYEVQKQEDIDRAKLRGDPFPTKYLVREPGWHESIDADVATMLAGKRYAELLELEDSIQQQLDSGKAADPEYWQAVLKRLALQKAKARLREIHSDLLQQALARMIAGPDVRREMGWEDEGEPAAVVQQQQVEEDVEEEEEEAGPPPTQEELAAAAAARAAAAADDNEIELAEDEEEGGAAAAAAQDGAAAPAAAARSGEAGAEVDAELAALAAMPSAKDREREEKAAANAARARQREAARGEPRSWEDLSDGEQEGQQGVPGSYSPEPLPATAYAGQDVAPEEDDMRLLEVMRAQIKYQSAQRYKQVSEAQAAARPAQAEADRVFRRVMQRPGEAHRFLGGGGPRNLAAARKEAREVDPEEAAFRAAANKMMGNLEGSQDATWSGGEVEVEPDSQVYWWHEKYRPRRPKYFNRVHTGYEWNKYNQTHYDGDNPPPKTVVGYKFNIFYPELLDRTKAPTYKVDRDPASPDGSTCILRFTAGPPYEDIAFRIINKPWNYNHKHGFRCVYERGILHLYFNFERQRYRR